MSNPAVVKLQKKRIAGDKLWMDDNFGESIHLHINDFRADMTTREFSDLYEQICSVLNEFVQVEGFDAHNIDPVFLECMLWRDLLHLTRVKVDQVKLSELLIAGKPIKPLAKSKFCKALKGEKNADSAVRPSDHIGQTRKMRMDSVVSVVNEKGYPYDGKYIILYGDDNVIQDGQHRAAAMLMEGDRVIPVQRFYFDNYKPVNLKLQMNPLGSKLVHIKTVLGNVKGLGDFVKKLKLQIKPFIAGIFASYRSFKRKCYVMTHKKAVTNAEKVLGNK